MIMAGRGRRLGDLTHATKKIGTTADVSEESTVGAEALAKRIDEIVVTNINPTLLNAITYLFTKSCTPNETLKNLISNLHDKALVDSNFGEKLVIALKQILHYQQEGTSVRSEILNRMQEDFKLKDSVLKSNKPKFFNSIRLLGNFYHCVCTNEMPYTMLGIALMEYFDLLIKGGEEELEFVATQIALNNEYFLVQRDKSGEYDKVKNLFQRNLRNLLVNGNLNNSCKCWVLLAIDLMSHNGKPLPGALRDFYFENLKEPFTKLELFMNTQVMKKKNIEEINSKESVVKNLNENTNEKGDKLDLTETFVDLSIIKSDNEDGSEREKKTQLQQNKNKKWQDFNKLKENGRGNSISGHDDRFEKHENFYGVQLHRTSKSENQKKNIQATAGGTQKNFSLPSGKPSLRKS